MRNARLLVIQVLAALTLLVGAAPSSAADPSFQNTDTLHLPSTLNQLNSFDISYVDSSTSTYVLADRNNASIDVFDTQDNRYIRSSDPVFTRLGTGPGCKTGSGPNTNAGNSAGPNGVVIVSNRGEGDDENNQRHDDGRDRDRDRGQAWAGDGDSTVKVIDLNTGHQVGNSIPTGGACRADELWADPRHREIMIGNPNDAVVTQTFISTAGTPGPRSVLGQLKFDGLSGCEMGTIPGVGTRRICHTVAATAGIEQPIFALDHFWVAIGATTENPGGEIAEIDPDPRSPTRFQRIAAIPVTCGPSGLTFIPPDHAAAACGTAGVQFFDLQSKSLIGTNVAETGGADQIWYANGNVYAPNSSIPSPAPPADPTAGGCARTVAVETTPNPPGFLGGQTNSCLAVIDASSRTVIAEVQLPAFAGSHSVAADSRTNKVFVPVRDSTCSTPGGSNPCPTPPAPAVPGSIPPCPPAEEGGCVHDQGIAVVQQ